MKLSTGNRTKVLLVLGLVAAYSSTSFAAEAVKVGEAVSKVNKSGSKTDGKGGGTTTQGKSCLSGAKAVGLKADQVGFGQGQMALNTTERGPEINLCNGKVKIATDPGSYNEKQPGSGATEDPTKKFGWCIQSQELAKVLEVEGDEAKKFQCNFREGDPQKGSKNPKIDFKFSCDGQEYTATILTIKDQQDRTIDSKVMIRNNDREKSNFLEIKQSYEKTGEDQVKGKFTVAEKPNSGTKPDQEAGSLHFPIEGKLKKPRDPEDSSGGDKFETCKVEVDGQGPKNENESEKPVDISLAGSCIIYRGSTVPMISEAYAGCKTTNVETGSISMMQERKGKSSGGWD